VLRNSLTGTAWEGVSERLVRAKPIYEQRLGEPLPGPLLALIRERLFAAVHPRATSLHLPG
jgi:hypothetical protein